jgi:hypothetical protein
MDHLAEMRALNAARRNGPKCGMELIGAPEDIRTAVAEAQKDPTIGSKAIAQFLQKRGINVPAYSVARHRRGDCACNRG